MFQVNYCEYNRSNADCDRIYRPGGSGDYLLLLLKTPMKCRLKGKLEISGEYKTEYYMGQTFDLSGMTFTATWSD